MERACEIRKFHVAVVQQRLRNVQKSVMHVKSCCLFVFFFFCQSKPIVFFPVRRRGAKTPCCCDPEILLPW